jgi:polyisoprenoid-binding protein YceI
MTEPTAPPAGSATAGRWTLDPAGSRADFYIKHFWGVMTVHGWFDQLSGEGTVTPEGAVTGTLTIDAASVNTKNKQRDKHLRSADFFHAEKHPQVVVTLTQATPAGPGTLACTRTLEAAGHVKPLEFTAQVEVTGDAAVLRTEIMIDRTSFDMTWGPLHMTASHARANVVARFVREHKEEA